jgi:N6-adenosine-specific RNA methylase IME4
MLVWHKVGNPSPWGGSVAPNHTEFLLVGVKGKPRRIGMMKSNVFQSNVSRHSEKPYLVYELIQTVSDFPAIELFARRRVDNWDAWGNEIEGSPVLGEESPALNTKEICHTAPNSGRDAIPLDTMEGN